MSSLKRYVKATLHSLSTDHTKSNIAPDKIHYFLLITGPILFSQHQLITFSIFGLDQYITEATHFYNMAATSLDYVTLISSDGFEFVLPRSTACVSGTIRRMLDPSSTVFSRSSQNDPTKHLE